MEKDKSLYELYMEIESMQNELLKKVEEEIKKGDEKNEQ